MSIKQRLHIETHTHHQVTIIHSSGDWPHLQPMLQSIYNTIYHSKQLIESTQPPTHLTASTVAPKSSHVHQQYKHTLPHHANNNNQSIKTIQTNTTQPPQLFSHKIHHKRSQTNTQKLQHTTNSTPSRATVSYLIPQIFHQQINPGIINHLIQHGNKSPHKRHHRKDIIKSNLPLFIVNQRFIQTIHSTL